MITVWEMNGVMNAGGTESLIMEILRRRGGAVAYRMVVHCPGAPQSGLYDEEIRRLGVPIDYLPSVGSAGCRRYERAFRALVEKNGRPDIVHIHMNAVGGLIARACRRNGITCRIIHCHANIRYRGSAIQNAVAECKLAVMKQAVRACGTAFWACSEQAARRLFGGRDAVIIPNCIDVDRYRRSQETGRHRREECGFAQDAYIIGAVGRVARIKAYETVIQALPLIRQRGLDAHFVCFGRIDDKQYFGELQDLAGRLEVGPFVHFMGNSAQVAQDIQMFDCFAMPSVTEGFGIAALEAQAAGLRTVVSAGVPSGVDMGLGLVSRQPVGDVRSWAAALAESLPCPPDGGAIRSAFEQKGCSAAGRVREIERMYAEMAGKDAGDRG